MRKNLKIPEKQRRYERFTNLCYKGLWFAVYDVGPDKFLDRYSVLDIDGDIHGCSANPFLSFGQFCFNAYEKAMFNFRHLGRKINNIEELPEGVLLFIEQRCRWQKEYFTSK